MVPRAEIAHWLAGSALLLLGLVLLSEVIVGTEVFRRRRWRAYLWPSLALAGGVLLWVIVAFSTFSTMHLLAHAVWAQVAMVAGAVQLAIVRGKLTSPRWPLVIAGGLVLAGSRSSSTSRTPGSTRARPSSITLSGGRSSSAALFPLGQALWPQESRSSRRLRADLRRRRGSPLRRPRRRPDLRPPLGHRRRAMRRLLVVVQPSWRHSSSRRPPGRTRRWRTPRLPRSRASRRRRRRYGSASTRR